MKKSDKTNITFYYVIAVIWFLSAIAWFISKNYIFGSTFLSVGVVYLAFAINNSKNNK